MIEGYGNVVGWAGTSEGRRGREVEGQRRVGRVKLDAGGTRRTGRRVGDGRSSKSKEEEEGGPYTEGG